MASKGEYIILVVALVILFFAVAGFILWHKYWMATPPLETCMITSNCPTSTYCSSDGTCVVQNCSVNSDCTSLPGSVCLGGFCTRASCRVSNDCNNIPGLKGSYICGNDNTCLPITSSTCVSNTDCYGGALSCINGMCAQCSVSSDCLPGEACINGSCQFITNNNSQDCVGGTLVLVPGNIASLNPELPQGFCCTNVGSGSVCSANAPCPSGQFCVNGTCRCVSGQLYEGCAVNSDCKSNNCINGTCGYDNSECLTNYNPNTNNQGPMPCPSSKPYCINGLCNVASMGAFCTGSYNSGNTGLCTGSNIYITPNQTVNISGTSTVNSNNVQPNGMGRYCVNNHCSAVPGEFNQVCNTSEDCLFYNSVGTGGTGRNMNCVSGRCVPNM